MKRFSGLALVAGFLLILVESQTFAQCEKNVNDNGVIQKMLEQYFKTSKVAGEPDAVIDWCYYEGFDQLFLFLMKPCESKTQAESMMAEIGRSILESCRVNKNTGKDLGSFEKNVLERGFTVQMMIKGTPMANEPLTTYIHPSPGR